MSVDKFPIFDARLKHPFSLLCAGASQSGKTTFLYNLLRNASRLIDIEFEYIVIFIGTEDSIFENLRPFFKGRLDIIQGLPESFDPFIDKSKAGLFIIEDLMRQSAEDIRVGDIFTKRGHHENLSICLVLQNLFSRGKERITCFRSSHYIVVFRNPLDSTVIFSLAQKLEPSKRKRATEMLNNIVTKYRYVLLDGKLDTPDQARYRSDIFGPVQRCFFLLR